MYALYGKLKTPTGFQYRFRKEANLFGCNKGWIPRLLEHELMRNHGEPLEWHIYIPGALAKNSYPDCALVIDIKPNNRTPELHL